MKNLTHSMKKILFTVLALVMVTTKAMGQDRAEMSPKKFSALEAGRVFTREALLKPCDCDQASFTFAPTRQWTAVDGFESKKDTTENNRRQRPSAAIVAIGGVLGGLAGFAAGGFAFGDFSCDDEAGGCSHVYTRAIIGEMVGVSFGAHLADKSQGDFPATFLASAGAGIASLLVLSVIGAFDAEVSTGVALTAIAVSVQVATAVVVERATNRTRK